MYVSKGRAAAKACHHLFVRVTFCVTFLVFGAHIQILCMVCTNSCVNSQDAQTPLCTQAVFLVTYPTIPDITNFFLSEHRYGVCLHNNSPVLICGIYLSCKFGYTSAYVVSFIYHDRASNTISSTIIIKKKHRHQQPQHKWHPIVTHQDFYVCLLCLHLINTRTVLAVVGVVRPRPSLWLVNARDLEAADSVVHMYACECECTWQFTSPHTGISNLTGLHGIIAEASSLGTQQTNIFGSPQRL